MFLIVSQEKQKHCRGPVPSMTSSPSIWLTEPFLSAVGQQSTRAVLQSPGMANSWQKPPHSQEIFPSRTCEEIWTIALLLACHSVPSKRIALETSSFAEKPHVCAFPFLKIPLHVPVQQCCRRSLSL